MEIRTGGAGDVDGVLALLDGAVAWLVAQGRTGQWGSEPYSAAAARVAHIEEYARDLLLRAAVADGDADGRLAGVCVLAERPPAYVEPAAERELYVRLLVTDRDRKGSGVGAALVDDAVGEARRRGVGLLRVDCYAGDDGKLVAQYERLGFTRAAPFAVERQGRPPWPGMVLERRVAPR